MARPGGLDSFGPHEMHTLYTGLSVPDPITFTVSPEYLDRPNLYPRQATLLKIIFLRDDLFTAYDHAVIDEWERAFADTGKEGVCPDVRGRISTLKARGARWFREVLLVMGRRGGKGHISAIAMAYVIWHYMAKSDPQEHYGVDRDKKLACMVFAGKREQAKANLWADVVNVVTGSSCFAPYVSANLAEKLSLFVPHDYVRMQKLADKGLTTERDLASLDILPKESTKMAARGPASFILAFDEMAHVVAAGANRSAEEVYESATPSLDQFGQDSFIIEPSSPYQMVGRFFSNYLASIEVDSQNAAIRPDMLMLQLPSWAQPLDTPVLTPTGWQPMGKIEVGDLVVGSRGKSTRVVKTLRPDDRDVYRVTMSDGTSTECSGAHLWSIQDQNERNGRMRSRGTVKSTMEISRMIDAGQTDSLIIPFISAPVQFAPQDRPLVPPYALGALLGDGCFRGGSVRFASAEEEERTLLLESLEEEIPGLVLTLNGRYDWGVNDPLISVPRICKTDGCGRNVQSRGLCSRCYTREWSAGRVTDSPRSRRKNRLSEALRELGLWGVKSADKFIPSQYLTASPEDRLALLQGLMDSDGTHAAGSDSNSFCNVSPHLTAGVVELVESLGGQARVSIRKNRTYKAADGQVRKALDAHIVLIRLPRSFDGAPFRLSRKRDAYHADRNKILQYDVLRRITSVEYVGEKDMQCIEVEASDGLYVTNNYIVTHNCIYEDWQQAHELDLLPEGFTGDLGEYLDTPLPTLPKLKGAVQAYDDHMRILEDANPETFAVERRSHFATVVDAYLRKDRIEAMFAPWHDRPAHYGPPVLQVQDRGILAIAYRGHADPSKSNCNFGLSVAHVERVPKGAAELAPILEAAGRLGIAPTDGMLYDSHVVFDLIKHWEPKDFENHIVDYDEINAWIYDNVLVPFLPSDFTFDQYSSVQSIQSLNKRIRAARLPKPVSVYEQTATATKNWAAAEVFKTALNLGRIHAPHHESVDHTHAPSYELAQLELQFLQKPPNVDKVIHQTIGPVQTKDISDTLMINVMGLIGDEITGLREQLAATHITPGLQGGIHPFPGMDGERLPDNDPRAALTGFGRRGRPAADLSDVFGRARRRR